MKKILLSVIFFMIGSLMLTGCSAEDMHDADPKNGFATEYSMTATEYKIFLTDKISALTDILMTKISMCNIFSGSEGNKESEIENAEKSIKQITYIENSVLTTKPPYLYETNRDEFIKVIGQARMAMNEYIEALKGNKDFESASDSLKAVYYTASGLSSPSDIVR